MKNLLPKLQDKFELEIYWLVYMPERINEDLINNNNFVVIDYHNYHDGYDVLNKIKPDVVFADADIGFIDYSLSIAAKKLEITIISGFPPQLSFKLNKKNYYSSLISRFFKNTTPTDTNSNQKKPFRRGKFILKKYLFLLETFFALEIPFLQIIKIILSDIKLILVGFSYQKRFAGTINWLSNEKWFTQLINLGFEKSNLFITGDPSFDDVFHQINKKHSSTNNVKPKVLIITAAMYEHGFWSRKQRDDIIKSTLSQLTKNNQFSIIVKIHPSSEIFNDYRSLLDEVDSSIELYQKGDVIDYLHDADVVISFASSSSILYAVLMKKPVIVINFLNEKIENVFIQRQLVLECTSIDNLVSMVNSCLENKTMNEKNLNQFIIDYLHKFDGNASKRLSEIIFSHFQKLKSIK